MTLTYEATIQESFVDGQTSDKSVDALDALPNSLTLHGNIASDPGGGYQNDASSATFSIVQPTYAKSIVAITDGGTVTVPPPDPVEVSPGDTVTYAVTVNVPSGDMEDLSITDFLPLPVYDADEMITFDAATRAVPLTPTAGVPASIPAAGTVAYGSNTTGFAGLPPSVSISNDSAANSFTMDFADNVSFEENPSDGATIQLLFTTTVTSAPFADGLNLVNLGSFTVSNSNSATAATSAAVIDVVTQAADLTLYKGVVNVEQGRTGVTTFNPGTVGPVSFAYAGSGTLPSFTAPFSSSELQANTVSSNASGLDGGDRVRFAIVVENDG